MKKYALVTIVSLLLGGVGGCGGTGSGANGSTSAYVGGGTLAALSNVNSVTNSAIGESATEALTVQPSNCIASEDSSGNLTSICTVDCEAGGKVQGQQTQTTVVNYGPWTSCTANGVSGMERLITGTVSSEFKNCAVEECGQQLILNGSLTGTYEDKATDCGLRLDLTTSYETSKSCSGLTIKTASGTTANAGLQMTYVNSTINGLSQTDVSGSLCDNGKMASFSSLSEFLAAVDPDGSCSEKGGELSCDECVNDCLEEFAIENTSGLDPYASCRYQICPIICGDYNCSAEDDQICQDAAAKFAPTALLSSYQAATKCVKHDSYPCTIACDQADPSNLQRCADLTANQIVSLGAGSFPECLGNDCRFTLACSGPSTFEDCPSVNECISDPYVYPAVTFFCSPLNTCQSDAECGEGVCLPLEGRDFSTCQCPISDTDGCVLIP